MLTALAVFAAAAGVVLLVGPRMARTASGLAQATGMGGAFFGVVFLSLATDLPEIALTPTAVLGGSPRIAIGGLLGAAAAQLVLIGVVDFAIRRRIYGRVRLVATLGQSALMMSVLAVPLVLAAGDPDFGVIGAGTLLMILVYLGVLATIRRVGSDAAPAPEEHEAAEEEGQTHSTGGLWARFVIFALLLAGAGVALEKVTEEIGSGIGIGQTAAGALIAGLVAPLPELVTALSAARAGAVELAVGDLVGSSALDVALLALADTFYTEGSIFELLAAPEFTLIGVSLAITSLLVVGLLRREGGSRRAGVESYLMLVVYAIGAAILLAASGTGG